MNAPPESAPTVRAALAAELAKPGSLALLFMATALSVVPALAAPEVKLPIVWPLTVLIFFVAYVWICSGAMRDQLAAVRARDAHISHLESLPNLQMPKVVRAITGPFGDGELLLLLRPNRLFGQSMMVSIYFEDERGLELLVGSGSVSNIQMNGFIQIAVSEWQEPHGDIRQKLIEQNQGTFDRIMVKPASNTASASADINGALLVHLMNRIGGGQQI